MLLPGRAAATVNGGRILCLGDSRTTFGGWQDLLVAQLNAAQPTLPTWNYRTNVEAALDWSYSILAANAAAYLSDSSCSLAFPTDIVVDLGEHDMGGVNASSIGVNAATFIDALRAKWFNARIYVDFPWAAPLDSGYASAKSQLQTVIAARSAFCFAGVDQGITLKGSDNGASETQDGIHFNNVPATCTAYATVLKTAILGF